LLTVYKDLLALPEAHGNADLGKHDHDGSEDQRDRHIKAHLKATPPNTIPTSALAVLHEYEAQSLPPPMSTYTRLISALFSARSSLAHAQAWDLFAHMRYVAHPKPDALLYTLMIRACAASPNAPSEPERALDLWTEMTVDNRIPPNTGTYAAIILACARSGKKLYVNEAFRLAKEMLDTHRDAEGTSAFQPDQRIFCALLEGAKRVGDLARTRWILAEIVRCSEVGLKSVLGTNEDHVDVKVNEQVMMHVFHTYAAYKPPFKRSSTILLNNNVSDPPTPAKSQPSTDESSSTSPPKSQSNVLVQDAERSFPQLPPNTHSEIITEAQILFTRILEDRKIMQSDSDRDPSRGKAFEHVQPTTRLLNAYLSVYYAHAPSLQVSRELFESLFAQVGVERNASSFVDALEKCGACKRGPERTMALAFSDALWVDWQTLENMWQEGKAEHSGVDARMVERAHIAMIRVLALTGNVDRALDIVRSFVERYPPPAVRVPAPKPAFRSTRTALVGARPLVRMTSSTEVPDDTVPPLLTFSDVEILHHRLVSERKLREIGYLKYVCKAYEGALRARRDTAMKATPLGTEVGIVRDITVEPLA
jgi:hypothetical protein